MSVEITIQEGPPITSDHVREIASLGEETTQRRIIVAEGHPPADPADDWCAELSQEIDQEKKRYEETGNPLILLEVLLMLHDLRWPTPAWLVLGIKPILEAAARRRPGRGTRSAAEFSDRVMTNFIHHLMVRALKNEGVSAREVFEAASQKLEGTRFAAAPDTIQKSCQRFKRSTG